MRDDITGPAADLLAQLAADRQALADLFHRTLGKLRQAEADRDALLRLVERPEGRHTVRSRKSA